MRLWVLTVVLVGAAGLARAEEPKPLPTRIREANLKACKAIAAKWARVRTGETTYEGHARTLVALTLLRAGGPEEREIARKLLDDWWHDAVAGNFGDASNPGAYGTYVVALGISALEALSLEPIIDDSSTLTRYARLPMTDEIKKRIEIATKALLDSSNDGTWSYNVRPFGKKKEGPNGAAWDTSNTQFAALGLHDAARAGVAIPKETIDGLAGHFVRRAKDDGEDGKKRFRWNYTDGGAGPTITMTCAAISALAIARSLGAKHDELDATITLALTDMNKVVKTSGPATDGEHGWGQAYLLYSLEKALDLLEIELLDGKDWFAPIAERVLKTQGGKGLYGEGDLIDSCLYVLFLQRATFGMSRLGPRTVVKVTAESDALSALKAYADGPNATTRAAAEATLTKLATCKEGKDALALAALHDLTKKNATRELAAKALRDFCGKEPSAEELALAIERLEKVRGPTPEAADLRAALAKTTLLPVRAYAAQKATALLVVEAADVLQDESVLESKAGARCAHAFEVALRKTWSDLPVLGEDVKPAELRHLVKVARSRK